MHANRPGTDEVHSKSIIARITVDSLTHTEPTCECIVATRILGLRLRQERLALPHLLDHPTNPAHICTRENPVPSQLQMARTGRTPVRLTVMCIPPPSAASTDTTTTATACSHTPAHTSHARLPLERAPHGSWTATATATPTTVVTTHAAKTATTYSHSPAHERRQ